MYAIALPPTKAFRAAMHNRFRIHSCFNVSGKKAGAPSKLRIRTGAVEDMAIEAPSKMEFTLFE